MTARSEPVRFRQLTERISSIELAGPHVILLLETGLAAVLALFQLGSQSFWLSEAYSYAFAKLDWSAFWQIVTDREANQSLYYVLLRPWLAVGEGEAQIRSLSLIFAVAAVPLMYALGSRLYGTRVGLISALLLAVNGFFIEYAQEARAYSLLLLLVTASSYLFVSCLDKPSWPRWAAYVLVSALAAYAHFFAGFVLLAHAASLLFLGRENVPWKGALVSGATTALLIAPLAVFVLLRNEGQLNWVAQPSLKEPAVMLSGLAGGKIPALAYGLACAGACLAILRSGYSFKPSPQTWRSLFILTWLCVPLAAAFVVSQHQPIYAQRFFMICLPPLVILAGLGISQISRRLVFVPALAMLVLFSLYGVATWHFDYEKDDWRTASDYVLSTSEPGDAVVFFSPVMSVPFDYYRDRRDATDAGLTYVAYSSGQPAARGLQFDSNADPVSETLGEDLASRFDRVWLIVSNKSATGLVELAAKTQLIQSRLEEDYSRTETRGFANIEVFLYERQ